MAENLNAIDRTIVKRIIEAREAAGLQKSDMADKLHITRQGYTPWEAGEHIFTADDVVSLSQILGKSVEWLLGIEGRYPPESDEVISLYLSIPAGLRRLALGQLRAIADVDRGEDQKSNDRTLSSSGRGRN